MRCAGEAEREGGTVRECRMVGGGSAWGVAEQRREEGDKAKEEGRWWKIKEVKPKRGGAGGGMGKTEMKREGRGGREEVRSFLTSLLVLLLVAVVEQFLS